MVTQVGAAWKEIGERRHSQHMRKSQLRTSERRIDYRQSGTISQVTVEPFGSRKQPKNFDGE